MTNIETLTEVTADLAAVAKPVLSLDEQVQVDVLLYRVGEAIQVLLQRCPLYDQWAPEVTLSMPAALPMSADKAKAYADQLWQQLYGTLVEIRHALCWNSIPPTPYINDAQRAAIVKAMDKKRRAAIVKAVDEPEAGPTGAGAQQ